MIRENNKISLFSTKGDSMFPFIRWNEEILVEKVLPKNIKIGDIVLFESDKGYKVCHRVVKIEDKKGILWFQTKTDRGKIYDKPFSEEAMLGKAIAIKRQKRFVNLYTRGWHSFSYSIRCLFIQSIFSAKKFLIRILR